MLQAQKHVSMESIAGGSCVLFSLFVVSAPSLTQCKRTLVACGFNLFA